MGDLRWGLLLAVMIITAGCVKVDQTLNLTSNGSGTADIRYGMSQQTIAQIEAMQQMGETEGAQVERDGPFDFDEAKVREKFNADKPAGVDLLAVSSEVVDGWKFVNVKMRFDNLAALKQTEFFADSGLSLTRDQNGNYVLSQRAGNSKDAGMPPPDEEGMGAAMAKQMAAMFAGMRIAMNVVVPGNIVETNATETAGNTATWVFDVDQDPTVLTRMDKTEMRLVFAGKGLNIPELPAE